MSHERAPVVGGQQTVRAPTACPGLMLLMSVVLLGCARSGFCLTDEEWTEALNSLKKVDSEVGDLEKRIREDDVGWWDAEIITAGRTNHFQSEYLALKSRLQPLISEGIRGAREQAAQVKTMGQALASLPEMVPLLMSFVDYQGRLDHIEFMIESRRSMILGRLSIWIAIPLGLLSIVSFLFSIIWQRRPRQSPAAMLPLSHPGAASPGATPTERGEEDKQHKKVSGRKAKGKKARGKKARRKRR